jgi:expansin (peptidoglycan-binding protein)
MISRNGNGIKATFTAVAFMTFLSGCLFGSYYEVRDPSSSTTYYTTDIDRAGTSGAVKFKDAKTGTAVTLQNSEVKEISKDEFKKAVPPAN